MQALRILPGISKELTHVQESVRAALASIETSPMRVPSLTVTGDLTVGGDFDLSGDITITGSLTVTGAVVLNSSLTVAGAANLNGGGALAGTFTGAPTFSGAVVLSGSPRLTTPWIADSSGGQFYKVAVSDLAADRTVTLPLLGASDVFVFADFAQTLTNKSLTSPALTGTVTGTPIISGSWDFQADQTIRRSSATASLFVATYSTTVAQGPQVVLIKSASGTLGTSAATGDGERLGSVIAQGVNSGNTGVNAGIVRFSQRGAAGATAVPTDIRFLVAQGGVAATDAFWVTTEYNVVIGATVAAPTSAVRTLVLRDGTLGTAASGFSQIVSVSGVLNLMGNTTTGTTLAVKVNSGLEVAGDVKFNGTNTTGAGTALIGVANSPAVTNTNVYTWIKAISADGSTVYIPAWK